MKSKSKWLRKSRRAICEELPITVFRAVIHSRAGGDDRMETVVITFHSQLSGLRFLESDFTGNVFPGFDVLLISSDNEEYESDDENGKQDRT